MTEVFNVQVSDLHGISTNVQVCQTKVVHAYLLSQYACPSSRYVRPSSQYVRPSYQKLVVSLHARLFSVESDIRRSSGHVCFGEMRSRYKYRYHHV